MGTASRQRKYQGPAVLSVGFRPFFLLAGLWAALAMLLWVLTLTGAIYLPGPLDATAWHVHEMIFGYGAAVVCGFLLTAVPNWTGRLPVAGVPLAALAAIWVAGRLAMALGAAWPVLAALVDMGFLAALLGIIAREIIGGNNRRNFPVMALVALFLVGNGAFHYTAITGGAAGSEAGARMGVAVLVILIALIGGRIVPSFTRNWLAKQAPGPLPIPFQRFDAGVLVATVASLGLWVALPDDARLGGLLLAVGVAHVARLVRWAGWRTLAEPLVTVLHVGYGFVPLGFLLTGAGALWPDLLIPSGAMHGWLAGAIGVMTLAVMTRASLGHSGRPLQAGGVEVAIYAAIVASTLARLAEGFGAPYWLLHLAGTLWIGGFGLFVLAYWPVLTRPRLAPKKPSALRSGG